MKNISDFLREYMQFQEFVQERGYELLMALGTVWEFYKDADSFEIQEYGVIMHFSERTNHDCPERETICLKVEEIEKTEEEWNLYIEETKSKTEANKRYQQELYEKKKLEAKNKQFEELKKELGK